MRRDQARKPGDTNDVRAKLPPEAATSESCYIAIGLGRVVSLRLRKVGKVVEHVAWEASRRLLC